VTTNSDDNEPTAAAGHADETAVVADSPRTVAAEQYSEAPTTLVPDLGPSRASELAWSSEAENQTTTATLIHSNATKGTHNSRPRHPRRWSDSSSVSAPD